MQGSLISDRINSRVSSENYSRQVSKTWNESAVLVNLYTYRACIFFNVEMHVSYERVMKRVIIFISRRRKYTISP